MAQDISLTRSDSEHLSDAQVADVQQNLIDIWSNFQDIQAQFNLLNAEVAAGGGSGPALELPLAASNVSVDTTGFNELFGLFAGTQLQQLLDFLDGLEIVSQPSFVTFDSNLIGTTTDLQMRLDQPIDVTYQLRNSATISGLNLFLNGVRIADRSNLVVNDSANQNVRVTVTPQERVLVLTANPNQVVSLLRADLDDGGVITSPTRLITQVASPVENFVYTALMSNINDWPDVQLSNDNRTQIDNQTNDVTFELPVAPAPQVEGEPLTGFNWAFFYPASLTLTSLINTLGSGNEINAWVLPGTRIIDGVEHRARIFGPLVEGAVITYDADFS